MNRLCLLALLALTTGGCAKERALSKTPPSTASKEKKGKKKEAEPNLPMTFLTKKEIKADKDSFSKKCSSLLVTNDLKLPKRANGEADVIKVFKKISQALEDQKVVGVVTEKENYLVVGTTKEEEARKVVTHFLKDESKNSIPGKAVPKEPKKKSPRSHRKKL